MYCNILQDVVTIRIAKECSIWTVESSFFDSCVMDCGNYGARPIKQLTRDEMTRIHFADGYTEY